MARRKLTLVVSCTDRKFGVPTAGLLARSLPEGDTAERVAEWNRRVLASPAVGQLLDLYKGESWAQTKRLAKTAREAGYDPEVLVASAGLGLRRVEDHGPAYAATFSRGHRDSVAPTLADTRTWWLKLAHGASVPEGQPSIWVLSEAYALAMQKELTGLNPDSALVFGGSSLTPDQLRIRSNRNLRAALGGTITSLNTRMAIRWLEMCGNAGPMSPQVRNAWDNWTDQVQQSEAYNRLPLTDEAVLQFIRDLRRQQPECSKTSALRDLRSAGFACEQSRFSRLFEEAATA